MAAIIEGPFPFKLAMEDEEEKKKSSSGSDDPLVGVLFFGICLILGVASKLLLRGSKVPYTVALLVIGIALGCLEYGTPHGFGKIGAGIRLWSDINPDLLLAVFLPALLFESAFSMDPHYIKSCMAQMFLMAGPGVLISTFSLGLAVKISFPYDWSWTTALLLGALLSATDPVAVVALLKDLRASKSLSTVTEGESLMNDGMAMVVYQLFYQMVLGRSFSVGAIVKYLIHASVGAVGIGLAFGMASFFWLGFIFNDTVVDITLTLVVSYISYFSAQDGADASGILTVMTLGMFYSLVARTCFKGDGQQSLHHFWEMVAYIANTLIFILSGVIIAEGVLNSKYFLENHESLWGYLILLYAFVQVSRFMVVGLLYPFLRCFGYGLDWKEAIILSWSGLRGPVSLALALSVNCQSLFSSLHLLPTWQGTSDTPSFLSKDTGTLFVFFTGGIVFLTLILNGSTAQFILHCLRMDNPFGDELCKTKRRILDYSRYEMICKALDTFSDLVDDEELGPSDWPTVRRYLACLNNLEGEQVHHHTIPGSENKQDPLNLKDIRKHLLNDVQVVYWAMLEEGRINQSTANIMMHSVDEATELVSHQALCDWRGLKANVCFPSYIRLLQMKVCPQKLVIFFAVERLELGCHICAAFLRAHRIARRQLHDSLGDSEIISLVINESEAEGEEARKFLEDVRVRFPQVLRAVKTRQITFSILKKFIDHLQNLEKVGLSEEKEIIHLYDVVQTDMKKLLRCPPLVTIPKTSDLLRAHPFFGALPARVQDPLEASTNELTELHSVAIYQEGSHPCGIWLVSNGLIKSTSTSMRNKHTLHPTFSHGSSLGLYEVLVEMPYTCTMITDTLVHCFFIPAERILSLLRSDPAIEEFLWQESVVVIAKLLLPQIYEKISMQGLRAIVVERSKMNIYTRKESIEIPNGSVGFLLEGLVKAQVQEEVISFPAVLLPPSGDLSFLSLETPGANAGSSNHQGSGYVVETRARVIVLDMRALEDVVLQKRSASWILQCLDLPRDQSIVKDFPGKLYMPRRLNEHSETSDRQPNSLSARAMQLSIFGSMVNNTLGTESFLESSCSTSPRSQGEDKEFTELNLNALSNEPGDDNNITVRIDSHLSLHQTS